MKLNPLWRSTRVLAVVGVFCLSRAMHAQGLGSTPGMELETRASLEVEAARAEAQHRTQEAWLLRTRLQKGDFQDGDRIVVKLLGSLTLPNDTVVVRAGKMLPLIPSMTDMSLEGVLRSELEARLSHHIGKYLKDTSVRAIPLLRLAVFGNVGKPGWFYIPADVLLNDAIMHAGGPGATADINNMVIRRGGDVIWSQQDTRTALADGMSLDRLHLRAGDELYVDDAAQKTPWIQYLQIAGPLIALLSLGVRYSH